MWVDLDTEVQGRMRNRVRDAERRRLAARARKDQEASRPPAGFGSRLREAAGFGLVRTGLRLLDIRRA